MTTTRVPSPIKPKISTMPRKQSEASQQLELYKLITEKQRIQKELKFMEQRIQQLKNRLTVLDHQIESTEQNIQDLREVNPSLPKGMHSSKTVAQSSNNFQAFYLEY
ncbi:gas vesicle protein [Planktothricoides raciborskii]|uniref:Gas vesicle protein n=1 Tax=Planktothricoides raciborskii GIHE-MW2 TaxID=2792601 RepID=A0AAU8JBI3_9CYAN